MLSLRSTLAIMLLTPALGCAGREPARSPQTPALTSATCPCANATPGGGGCTCSADSASPGPAGMGGCHGGAMMHGGPMGPPSGPPAPAEATPALSSDAKSALLRAIDEEHRAEALYGHVVRQFGAKPPVSMIARAEHRHAWVLESLALAHDVELPPNPWTTAKQTDYANVAAACRAGVESETKTITMYDELLKLDLPPDLRRAFTNLRAASNEHHRPAFEACR